MRSEYEKYYPDVTSDRIHVVGTPQFDPYADESLLWYGALLQPYQRGSRPSSYLLLRRRHWRTCPEDPQHLRVLLELIRAGDIEKRPQVLLRPAPVDDGCRYADVRRNFPELIYAQPEWRHTMPGDWSRVIPLRDDVQFLANLTHHAT